MRACLTFVATTALAACAATPMPEPMPGPGPEGGAEIRSTEQDCAVIAAVARQHYGYGGENAPLPLWNPVEENGATWRLTCDWSRYGLSFPRTYQPTPPRPGEGFKPWVKFERPRYTSRGATVATSYLMGPLAGAGQECELVSGVAGWTVRECRMMWIS